MTRRLTGLAATLTIAALLIGVPAILVTVGGNPFAGLPSLEVLGQVLIRPDDGTALLRLLWYAAWIGWLILAALVTAEVAATIGGVRLPTLPAIAPMQGAARTLVATAALLFIATPLLSLPAPPAHATPINASPLHVSAPASVPVHFPVANPVPATTATTYTVRDGDTLWSIAERFLGDGNRYPELHQLNRTVVRNPNTIWAGMVLRIPASAEPIATAPAAGTTSYTVKKGDTLSGIAQRLLGNPDRYPEIFEASRTITQPGGYHLTNPDQIDIGWTLSIPSAQAETPVQPTQSSTNGTGTSTGSSPATTSPPPTVTPPPGTSVPPTATASPTTRPTASSSSVAAPATPAPDESAHADDAIDPAHAPWLLTGLSMGGALLAAGLLLALRRATRMQFRARRPGRGLRTTEPKLAPVHRSITAVGVPALPTLERLDQALRRTGPRLIADDVTFPLIERVELTAAGDVRLHLAEPAAAPLPWEADAEGLIWTLSAGKDLAEIGPLSPYQPAPWPLLVTLGTDNSTTWLINLEHAGTIHLAGDPTYAADYLRYLTTELAINPWAADITIHTDDQHLYGLNPARPAPHGMASALQAVQVTAERIKAYDTTAPRSRTDPPDGETWGATAMLIADGIAVPDLSQIADLVGPRSASALVTLSDLPSDSTSTTLAFTPSGRVKVAALDLMAVGLTADEAAGCAALLAQADDDSDVDIPPAGDEGWRALSNQAGALRKELTTPRNGNQSPNGSTTSSAPVDHGSSDSTVDTAPSVLPEADESYLTVAATVTEDLKELAPRVPVAVRSKVHDADPHLDRDLAWWHSDSCPLPRLTLLGPVTVRAHGTPISKRKPYYIEVVAYLALREHGATTEEVADAFGVSLSTARNAAKTIRDWLGTDPTTGLPHLPDADKSRSAKTRGIPTYQLGNVLCDADLFRRLRLRGEATPNGIYDLEAALALVTGKPFDQRRPGGWNWLTLTGIDSHITCAIVDVAHVVATNHLSKGGASEARTAAQAGIQASPENTISRLDLAAAARLDGHHAEALQIVRDEICNWADEDGMPFDLELRTRQILDQLGFMNDLKAG